MLEQFDGHARLRNALRTIAAEQGHWAGIPMPLTDEQLVIEPRYPHAQALMEMGARTAEEAVEDDDLKGAKVVNRFWSSHKQSTVIVIRKADGTTTWGIEPGIHHFSFDLHGLGCADAWGIEQESRAVQTLATLIGHRQFKQYLLTGMFMESSPRSRLHYVFRRLRPTVALHDRGPHGRPGILCTLCLHPIGYYAGSWAGAMCPTDDVLAHLMLMRGDEPMLWRRANQHPPWLPQSGL